MHVADKSVNYGVLRFASFSCFLLEVKLFYNIKFLNFSQLHHNLTFVDIDVKIEYKWINGNMSKSQLTPMCEITT